MLASTISPVIRAASALACTFSIAVAACGGAQGDVCDPSTIEVNGTCHWTKEAACDAAQCLPPSECVIVEDKPAHVTCQKAE